MPISTLWSMPISTIRSMLISTIRLMLISTASVAILRTIKSRWRFLATNLCFLFLSFLLLSPWTTTFSSP